MRAILLDVDGVVIKPRDKYFSEKLSKEYDIPLSEIIPFFKNEYKKAAIGKADIKKILPSYLRKWGWKKGTDSFLRYWYESEKEINEKVIDKVMDLRKKGIKVFLVSDNEKGRANFIMENLGLKNKFNGGFFSCSLGITKSDPQFFKAVMDKMNIDPKQIFYWDDDPKNIDVAEDAGINAFLFTSNEDFVNNINHLMK
jgi:putative hydrolase of the HAD superfamily